MTESEFQEFLITVGYRYNSKSKSGFNTFEGFHTIIEFLAEENRYSLLLGCNAEDMTLLLHKLKSFSAENKTFITKALYKDRRIKINVKMTVDSDIDRENLKNVTRYITELCKSGIILPICRVCSRNRKTGMYIVGRELMPICDKCIVRKRRQYERRRDMFIKKKQNMPAGLAGAFFGAALGASVYILLYQFWQAYGIWAGVIAVCTFAGYVIAGKRATKLSAVFCEIISFAAFLCAEYCAIVANMAILIERQGGGIVVTEAIESTNNSFSTYTILNSVIFEILIGTAIMAVIGVAYFLKRKYTRPLKISNNIL